MTIATIDESALFDLHQQAQHLVEQGNFRDAISLYELAIQQGDHDISARARAVLAGVLADMSNAVAGRPNALHIIEANYLRIKQLIDANLRENPGGYWGMQASAVLVAGNMRYDYTGPRGVMGVIASGGAGAHQLAKQSEDSYKRLTNELLLLARYGRDALESDGCVLDFNVVGAAYAALEAIDVFVSRGRSAPVHVLDFFASLADDQILATADDDGNMATELANVRRLIQARRGRS